MTHVGRPGLDRYGAMTLAESAFKRRLYETASCAMVDASPASLRSLQDAYERLNESTSFKHCLNATPGGTVRDRYVAMTQ
jgi:hypothetical protein